METKAWCAFSAIKTNASESYRVRFNKLASKLLAGCDYVYIQKTTTHLIITPLSKAWKAAENNRATHFYWDGSSAVISLNKLVLWESSISPDLFGKRYKVKKSSNGKVYICLLEPIEEEK